MSSTTNVQSYLTNVFRPVYTYSLGSFTANLELSNIDTVSANNAILLRADVADSGSNVYVGTRSGNSPTFVQFCSNVTAFGYSAGTAISSVSNSVFLGYGTGANSASNNNVIAIGTGAGTGNTGSSNILIGNIAGSNASLGANNILLGNALIGTTSMSNQFQLGTSNVVAIAADLSYGCVSIGKSDTTMSYISSPGYRFPNLLLDVAGYARFSNGVTIGVDPGTATLDVNGDFRVDDGTGYLRFTHYPVNTTVGRNSYLMMASSNGSNLYVDISGIVNIFSNLNVTGATTTVSNLVASNFTVQGTFTCNTSTTTNGNYFMTGNLIVGTNADVSGTLLTLGTITGQSNLSISGDTQLNTLTVSNTANFNGNMFVSGDLTVGILTAGTVQYSSFTTSNMLVSSNLTVGVDASLGRNLFVAGLSDVSGALNVTGAATLSNTLLVSNAATLCNTLGVSGIATLSGATRVSNTLNVTGATVLSNSLNVSGSTTLAGTTTGALSASSVSATSATIPTLNGAVSFASNVSVGGTLAVTAATTLSNTLGVTGNTNLSGTLSVTGTSGLTGNVTASGTLQVTGATTLSNTLTVSGATTISNSLTVTGAATLSNGLTLTGALNGGTINAGSVTATGGYRSVNGTFGGSGVKGPNTYTLSGITLAAGMFGIVNVYDVTGALYWETVQFFCPSSTSIQKVSSNYKTGNTLGFANGISNSGSSLTFTGGGMNEASNPFNFSFVYFPIS